ncbi:putative major facilitator superfamily transporter [Zalerion maritima]|uniref:Major facilitator superfamily transporter n=1 Tax=Zalerion maritima TaxID=339359 RepID=A0AAD5RPQ8_9PEZI|nr:putative major facilitator superfamily transporter [Zalerion maritima]
MSTEKTPAKVPGPTGSGPDLAQSGSDDGITVAVDGADEKKMVRTLDWRLIPTVMCLYLFSFLDRVNIGNARLYGMEEDLGMQGNDFQLAVSILFITYLAFEVPSNLLLKYLRPSRYLAFLSAAWGIVALCTGLVQSYASLIALRLILGVLEAGLFPGLNVYLTFFYTRGELALRVGYLFVSAALAGGVGGLLAYGIGMLDGERGWSGWRWIMVLEGIPSIILGAVAWFALPDDADAAPWLSSEEKNLCKERRGREYGRTETLEKHDVIRALADWKVWIFCLGQFGVDTMLYGYSSFLPTIIKAIGDWSSAEVQLLTIPCYAIGAILYMGVAHWSDKTHHRGIFCVAFGLVSVVGYSVLISDVSAGAKYAGCFLIAAGLYIVVGLPLAWMPNNCPRYGKRTTANGMQLTCGNSAGIMAPFIYPTADSPRYIKGHAITLALVAMTSILYAFMTWYYYWMNGRRDEGVVPRKQQEMSEEELEELGDDSCRFRYTI